MVEGNEESTPKKEPERKKKKSTGPWIKLIL